MYLKKFYLALPKIIHASKINKLVILLFFIVSVSADSFNFNSYNNHGVVCLINMPTARLYDESVYGLTIYDGTPDQKITLTSNPFNWMEASFFYTNIQNKSYCGLSYDPVCKQDYKDKGFNIKLRLKEEGVLPAIAVGFNDFAGTGYYSSEYIVGSYGIMIVGNTCWVNLISIFISFRINMCVVYCCFVKIIRWKNRIIIYYGLSIIIFFWSTQIQRAINIFINVLV